MAGAVQAIARPEVVKLSDFETQAKAAPATPPNSPSPGKARDVVEDNESSIAYLRLLKGSGDAGYLFGVD
ncbi:hypothetical protein diail_10430 [Diaporthe ilicicola]|nr:hypothetical protein diail_10430 [Diaporthe ilicicola]